MEANCRFYVCVKEAQSGQEGELALSQPEDHVEESEHAASRSNVDDGRWHGDCRRTQRDRPTTDRACARKRRSVIEGRLTAVGGRRRARVAGERLR